MFPSRVATHAVSLAFDVVFTLRASRQGGSGAMSDFALRR